MHNEPLFPKSWSDLTREDKIRGLIGWTIFGVLGAGCFKLGQRSGRKTA